MLHPCFITNKLREKFIKICQNCQLVVDWQGCVGSLDPYHEQDHLYLINADGDKKTILAVEQVARGAITEQIMSILWLNGIDTDGNDISDTWSIADEFNVQSGNILNDLTTPTSESEVFKDFIPISPLRTNITNLKFYIAPLEDPYKGFAETAADTGTLVQPHITIVITAEPSASELSRYIGLPPNKTLQTTIYSEIRQNVESF